MAIDERSRHLLFQRLETILGADEATTLMEHLPPVGWADVATRHDLDVLRESVDRRFDAVDRRSDEIDRRFDELDRRFGIVDRQFGELEERMTLRIESSENRVLGVIYQQIATVHDQIAGQTRTLTLAMVSSVLTAVALSIAAVHL